MILRSLAILALLAAGFLAGAQLGKLAPLATWYQSGGMTLTAFGWLVAAIGFFVAIGAVPAAILVERLGLLKAYALAALSLAAGGIWLALAGPGPAMMAARLVEAFGYVLTVIAAPTLMTVVAPQRLRAAMLAAWSAFVPAGFAIAGFLSSAMLPDFTPQTYLLVTSLVFAVLSAAALVLSAMAGGAARDATSAGTGIAASADRIVLLVALAFAIFVIVSLAYFTFLPAYSEGRPGLFLMHPGAIVLFVPLGNLTATLLVARLSGGGVARLSIAAFALCAIAGLVLFQAEDSLAATLAGILLSVGLGIVASAVYAMIPFVVPRGGSAVIVIGLVSQAGGLATLAGPPVAGFIVDRSGWPMLGVFIAATSVLGMAALWPGRNVARL